MIKGNFKTFGYWLSIISIIGGTITTIYFLFFDVSKTPVTGQIFLFVVLAILIGGYGRLLYDSHFLCIDVVNKTIVFTNQMTRKQTVYSFDYFDGRIFCLEPVKGGYAKNLYLVKDNKAVKKITDFMYSNYSEIEDALKPIQDLGTFKYSYLKTWKISLGLPILN